MKRNKGIMKKMICLILSILMVWGSAGISGYEIFAEDETEERRDSALESYIKNMNLAGYVGENLIGNVKNWQKDAYENNRGIIEQIALASLDTPSLGSVLGTDYFGVDGYYDINIKNHDGNKLGWTLKNMPGSFSDRDFKFANDPSALTDWSGSDTLWVYVDSSEIPSATSVRIAFEENAVGRESYSLIEKSTVYLWDGQKKTETTVAAGGYVNLDAGFVGYIGLGLNNSTFTRYYNQGGNNKLDLSKVVQFQLSVKGKSSMVGKTLYMNDFIISGDVDGEKTSGTSTFKTVWTAGKLAPRLSYTGAMVIWYGEFVGKLLTGMAYSYKATGDETLKEVAADMIKELSEAQGEDGYLGVFLGGARYSISANNWDIWNQYHCIIGMLEWYKLTQNQTALDTAKKCLDCIYETFKDRSYIVVGGIETNRSISHGYTMMYTVTKEKKYLDEAIRLTENDYKKNDPDGWYNKALKSLPFYTSSCSRWEVLHMVMTLGVLYEETGNQEYYKVMTNVWESVLKTDIHNSGGFTTNEGACGSPYAEGIIETCCTIAWGALTNEYLKYNKTVRVADELERSYFNGLLGSLLDDDKYCTYNTPMDGIEGSCTLHGGVYDGRRVPSQQDISFQFNTGSPDMNCCQANIARGIGQIAEWAVLSGNKELYLNYYGPSSITTLVDGKEITLTQTTDYPENGKIKLVISGLENQSEFTLKLRIPTWTFGSQVSFDGTTKTAASGEYFAIDKTWKNGDTVTIDLKYSFTYWAGEKAQKNYTSVFYGPILLTLDKYFAPNCTQNTKFDIKNIENAVISKSNNGGWLTFDVDMDGKTVRLVDFASAGKYNGENEPSTYWSWLKVEGAPAVKKKVTWQNTDKLKITFGENISYTTAMAYSNNTVKFTVNPPEGYVVDSITSTVGDVEITNNGLEYSFTMPDSEIGISASFKKLEKTDQTPSDENTPMDTTTPEGGIPTQAPTTSPAEKNSSDLGGIIGAILLGVAAIGAAAVIIIKKRKK